MSEEQGSSMQRLVQKIPVDIYSEILGHLDPPREYQHALIDVRPNMHSLRNRTIRSMALVCRTFYNHFFPYLFENVYVQAQITGGDTPSHCARFCKSIVLGDQRARTLATYVKTYAIVFFNLTKVVPGRPASQTPRLEENLSIYSKALGFMSNLRDLFLFHSSITNDLLRATKFLPALKLLRLEECNVPKPLDPSLLRSFANLRVANVYERDMEESEPSRQLLKHFCLSHTENLESDETRCYLLHGLASRPPMDHIQSVKFSLLFVDSDEYLPTLSNALKAMPQLKSLQFGFVFYAINEGVSFNFHTEFPPLAALEDIRAQLSVLRAIVPGSLVSSICIAEEGMHFLGPMPYQKDASFWKPIAETFKKSQRPIENLDIPMSFYCGVPFASHFPNLRFLTVKPKHRNWFDDDAEDNHFGGQPDEVVLVAAFLESWHDHPKLTELEFAYDPISSPFLAEDEDSWDMPYRVCEVSEDTLAALKLRIPSLQSLTFSVRPPKFEDAYDETFKFHLGED